LLAVARPQAYFSKGGFFMQSFKLSRTAALCGGFLCTKKAEINSAFFIEY